MAAPVNTVLPVITGELMVGLPLTCSQGTWTGGVQTYAFQWQETPAYAVNGFTDIAGATSNTYTPQSSDVNRLIRCNVTATNNQGSTVATSLPTEAVPHDFFVAEDGTGLANANSLSTLEDADSYFAIRSDETWRQQTKGRRKAALIEATDFMEEVWGLRWKGVRLKADQALSWPREFVEREDFFAVNSLIPDSLDGSFYYPSDQIPAEVKKACAMLALRSLTEPLSPDIAKVQKRAKIGPIEVEYETGATPWVKFRAVENTIAKLLKTSSPNVKVAMA